MKNFPFYSQPGVMDCGPTCLRMVAKYYKKSIPLQFLRENTQIGKQGVNLLGISDAAESIGFRTQSIKLSYKELKGDARLPAILHWRQNHFIILYKIKQETFFIADPAAGLIKLSATEFKQNWISDKTKKYDSGVALLLEPSPAFYNDDTIDDLKAKGLVFKNIFKYILPYKKLVLQLIIGLAVASILQLFLPFLTQSVVDVGVNTANIHFVYIVLLAQLALFAGRMIIEFVRGWILLHISTRINVSILTDFLIKLMKLPVSFFDSKHTGDVMQRMNDHSRIENFLTGSSINVIFSLLNLVIFSIVLAVFNTGIFIVFAGASFCYSSWIIFFLKKRRDLDYRRFEIASKEQGVTIQLVQGMQEIKLNGVERQMRWIWERLQAKLFRLSMKNLSLNQLQEAGGFFMNEGKNILITYLSAKAVIDGQMTLGSMLAVQYIIGQLNSPIEQLIGFVQSLQNAKISMDRLNEIHAMEDEESDKKNLLQELPVAFTKQVVGGKGITVNAPFTERTLQQNGREVNSPEISNGDSNLLTSLDESTDRPAAICFQNVTFTYTGAGNDPVLRDINLQIPKGKTTAIVGISGSGKTTLLKLLLKFYQPQKGEIKLDDTSLSAISHKVWRSHCGVVMQESFIFSDSIAKNIAVGVDTPDMERMKQSVELANVKEFIERLPLGYNTKIGAEGTGISMGQKQRILIARAIYRNPEFIFFDEATNSLDANNESVIMENLESFFKGRTVVVVAHRLSTVKHADQIVVLNKGTITEKGSHKELINLRGEYWTLVKNQLELGD